MELEVLSQTVGGVPTVDEDAVGMGFGKFDRVFWPLDCLQVN